MRSPLVPDRFVRSLPDIDLDELAGQGVRCVLLDRDNTCVPRDTKVEPSEVADWLGRASSMGIRLCLVSNNWHSGEVEESAQRMGVDVVHHAMKPAPFAVTAALVKEGVPADQAVLIGDQIFTDMTAGNLAGVRTILVRPQSMTDLWYTQVFRLFETPILRGRVFEGEDHE